MTTPRCPHQPGHPATRPELCQAWDRSRQAGVTPEVALGSLEAVTPDPDSPLLRAAAPVLTSLEESLAGSRNHMVLADRHCRLVYRWHEDGPGGQLMDEVGVVLGTSFLESAIGANALGTAFELRKPLGVEFSQHYARALRAFSCYSRPIFHPLTRRVEGILNVSQQAVRTNPLVVPLLTRAVEDIQFRLVQGARSSERALFGAFEVASKRTRRPLVGIGADTVVANRAAWDLMEPADIAAFRALASSSAGGREESIATLTLARGTPVRVHVRRLRNGREGALFHLEPAARVTEEASPAPGPLGMSAPASGRPARLLVSGPAGSGRSTVARALCAGEPSTQLRATTVLAKGEAAWAATFLEQVSHPAGVLIVEDLELLPDRLVAVVLDTLTANQGPRLVFTATAREELTGRYASVAALCEHIDLLPLSQRGDELAALARSMLEQITGGGTLRLTPTVVEALRASPWPGNLHELKAVLTQVAGRRSSGDVILADLPEAYRSPGSRRPLAGLERAEREAIARALAQHLGNKSKAADALGISRTTLYTRMRALRIAG